MTAYELRPLPRRTTGRRRAWRRVERLALWVRRGAIAAAGSVALFNVLCSFYLPIR